MEEKILFRNVFLKEAFENAEMLYNKPLTISQISFDKKTQLEHHLLMTGDAAGMIAPLCGNGMSMAMHGSKMAFEQMDVFLQHKISRYEMEYRYQQQWEEAFSKRLKTGRFIQSMFGRDWVTNYFISALYPFPFLVDKLVKQTHGEPF